MRCPAGAQALFTMRRPGSARLLVFNLEGAEKARQSRDLPAGPASLALDCAGLARGLFLLSVRLEYNDGSSETFPIYRLAVLSD
jgi:hypothetical protein